MADKVLEEEESMEDEGAPAKPPEAPVAVAKPTRWPSLALHAPTPTASRRSNSPVQGRDRSRSPSPRQRSRLRALQYAADEREQEVRWAPQRPPLRGLLPSRRWLRPAAQLEDEDAEAERREREAMRGALALKLSMARTRRAAAPARELLWGHTSSGRALAERRPAAPRAAR